MVSLVPPVRSTVVENREINGTDEIGLVTPTPVSSDEGRTTDSGTIIECNRYIYWPEEGWNYQGKQFVAWGILLGIYLKGVMFFITKNWLLFPA